MNYCIGDFQGIGYTISEANDDMGTFFDTTKKFVSDNQMVLLALAIAGLGIYALLDNQKA